MHEYMFEVKLQATVCVAAENEKAARRIIETIGTIPINVIDDGYQIIEATLDDCSPTLVKMDEE